MEYIYSYLILDLLFLILWLALFFWRKDVRKEMWTTSILFGIIALIMEPIIFGDWWTPLTITNTIPGIESFLFGFTVGGLASVIYEEIFKKKLKKTNSIKETSEKKNIRFSILSITGALSFIIPFYIFKINSFIASSIAMIIMITMIYYQRKDLIKNSIVSGIAVLISAFIIYSIMQSITPGWIDLFWVFKNTPKIIFLNVPIDDIVWFFLFGALWGPIYEYWQNKKLVRKK